MLQGILKRYILEMIHVENISRIIILDLSLDFQTYYMVLNLGMNKITSLLLSLKNVFPLFMYVFDLTFFIPKLCCTIQCSVTITHSHTLKLILFLTVRTASVIIMDAICFCIQELRKYKNYSMYYNFLRTIKLILKQIQHYK